MHRDNYTPPIVSFSSAIKGLLAGGILALSLFSDFYILARILIFVIGFVVFVDSCMPVDRGLYAITTVFFLVVSGFIGYTFIGSGQSLIYLIIMLILGIFVYLNKIRKMRNLGKIR